MIKTVGIWLGFFMVFNATINNILVISWREVLLVEETAASAENHIPVLRFTIEDYPFWYLRAFHGLTKEDIIELWTT
jgi:hypothetical protein